MSQAARIVAGIGIVLGCVALWLSATAGAATLSDDFAGREKVTVLPVEVPGSNVGADREAGEPVLKPLSPAGHSVWLEWEAKSSGYFTFSTCDSAIPTVLGLYVGSEVDKLSEQESAADYGSPECSGIRDGATLLALNGANIQVVLDGNGFYVPPALPPVTEGPLSLRIEATPPAANDDFKDATALAGTTVEEPGGDRFYSAAEFGYNWNATKEAGEPKHAGDSGGSSVWYTWTAPESGLARIGLCCGTANLLGVYAGGAVDALTPVQSGKSSVEVPVTAGATYRIAVDSEFSFFLGGTFDDSFDLIITMALAPGPRPADGSTRGGPPSSDVTDPQTTIFRKKVRSKARSATFSFRSNEPGSSFRCRLDRRKAAPCASPKSLTGLAPGQHVFKVRAVDASGNADPTQAIARFTIVQPRRVHR